LKKKGYLSATLGIPPLLSSSPDTIAALLWAREVLQQHLTTTYAVNDPNGIEELKPIKVGGVDQWLHIRGRNRNNPILLYLHGGPGFANIGLMDAIQRPWEDYFTVVQWDQRQTGKSANDETEPLTLDQLIEDTEEVVQYLQHHLNQEKLFLLGHSWGSVPGMHLVKRHPDWLHAYIGIGQVVNMMDSERVLYERLFSHAKEQKESQLIDRLEAIAPYPNPDYPEKSFVENGEFVRRELSRLAGETGMHHLPPDEMATMFNFERAISPHLTLTDLSHSVLGDEIALLRPPYGFTKEFLAIDLPNDVGSSFEVPILFFSGTHDWQTPRLLSDNWFSQINAPHKELIHFEESCHVIVNEEPGKVLTALVNTVLPFAQNVPNREINHV
jgi:pimeloyl-ACP methyl ester carboxylesterase